MERKIEYIYEKILDTSNLVTTTVLGKNIKEVEDKTLDVNGLVTAFAFNDKLKNLRKKIDHDKYVTTPKFNKFCGTLFNEQLKEANLATESDLDTVLQCANKDEEKKQENFICLMTVIFLARIFLMMVIFKIYFSTNI